MPLTAMTDEDEMVVSIDCNREQWLALSLRELRCPDSSCGAPMHRRTPGDRVWHFAHNPGSSKECSSASGESPEHLELKVAIYRACRAIVPDQPGMSDVTVSVEHQGPSGWRADAYVALPERKIAFEIQLSPQSPPETTRRTDQRTQDDVGTVWVVDSETQWQELAAYAPAVLLSRAAPPGVTMPSEQWWVTRGWHQRVTVPFADGTIEDVDETAVGASTFLRDLLGGCLVWSTPSQAFMSSKESARLRSERKAHETRIALDESTSRLETAEAELAQLRQDLRQRRSARLVGQETKDLRLRVQGLEYELRRRGVNPDHVPEPFR